MTIKSNLKKALIVAATVSTMAAVSYKAFTPEMGEGYITVQNEETVVNMTSNPWMNCSILIDGSGQTSVTINGVKTPVHDHDTGDLISNSFMLAQGQTAHFDHLFEISKCNVTAVPVFPVTYPTKMYSIFVPNINK